VVTTSLLFALWHFPTRYYQRYADIRKKLSKRNGLLLTKPGDIVSAYKSKRVHERDVNFTVGGSNIFTHEGNKAGFVFGIHLLP